MSTDSSSGSESPPSSPLVAAEHETMVADAIRCAVEGSRWGTSVTLERVQNYVTRELRARALPAPTTRRQSVWLAFIQAHLADHVRLQPEPTAVRLSSRAVPAAIISGRDEALLAARRAFALGVRARVAEILAQRGPGRATLDELLVHDALRQTLAEDCVSHVPVRRGDLLRILRGDPTTFQFDRTSYTVSLVDAAHSRSAPDRAP